MSNDYTMMIFQLFGLLYSAFTLVRLIQYVMKDAGLGEFGKYAWIFALVGIIALMGSMGESGFYVMMGSLFFVTYLTSIIVVFEGGQAAGALFNKGFFQAIPTIILVLASVAVGFLEPLISAPLYTVMLGLNIYLEYQDAYGLMYKDFTGDEMTRYIFVWPPLVLLIVFTDIFVLSNLIGSFGAATIATVLTLIGIGVGYYRTKTHKAPVSRTRRETSYPNLLSNSNTQDGKSIFSSLGFYTCPECKKLIFQQSDHGLFCSQNPTKQWMDSKTCPECKKFILQPSDHGLFCSQNPSKQWMDDITCPECKKMILKPNDHAYNCSKFRFF